MSLYKHPLFPVFNKSIVVPYLSFSPILRREALNTEKLHPSLDKKDEFLSNRKFRI